MRNKGAVSKKGQSAEAFLESLADTYSVTAACKTVGVGRTTAYRWREGDEDFASRWDEALAQAAETLEATIYQRAMAGTDKASATLAIFLLKGAFPDKYARFTRNEITGAKDGPLQVEFIHAGALAGMTDEELRKLAAGER